MRIKELQADDRPMEKMLLLGAAGLSTAELIGIIIRSGSTTMNAVDTARKLLSETTNNLSELSCMSAERLMAVEGIGRTKALSILAALELGRRFSYEGAKQEKVSVTGPEIIYKLIGPMLKGLSHEECWAIFLNRANYIIGKERMTSGGLSSTIMEPRGVIARALEKKASGVILVHNHPSGNPRPGNADAQQTETLRNALRTMDISLLDHIIICDDCYYSFADESVSRPI